jgi:outer membrane immunogenic protein
MKKLATAIAAIALIGTPALAADMAVKMPVQSPPPPAPIYSWTGFYIGGDVGGGWSSSDFSTNPGCPPNPATNSTFCNGPPSPFAPNGGAVAAAGTGRLASSAFTGGVQTGHNWQTGAFVYGVEADFNSLSLKRSVAAAGIFPVPFSGNQFVLTEDSKTSWLATMRGRLGVTVVPRMLLYATGGAAFADFKFSSTYNDNAPRVGMGQEARRA